MQFQVPQFIEIEDKLVGPLTLKQFAYLAIAALFLFLLFFVLQTWLWLIVASIVGSAALAMAFLTYNGRPLIHTILAALAFLWRPKLYTWKRSASALPSLPKIDIRAPKEKTKTIKHLWLEMNTSTQPIEKREKKFSAFDFFKKSKELVENFEVYKKQTGDQEISRRVDYR